METTSLIVATAEFRVDDWMADVAYSFPWKLVPGQRWPQYRGLFLPQYVLGGTRGEIEVVDGNPANCTQANLRVKPNKYVRWRESYEATIRKRNMHLYNFKVQICHGPAGGFIHWVLDDPADVYLDHSDVTWIVSPDHLRVIAVQAPWAWEGRQLINKHGKTLSEALLGRKSVQSDLRHAPYP